MKCLGHKTFWVVDSRLNTVASALEGGGYIFVRCKMQRGEAAHIKRARVLCPNEIREIIMDSDSDVAGYNTSSTLNEQVEPRPPS
jgi:hypothetical protein